MLDRLAHDGRGEVRLAVARHPALTAEAAEILVMDRVSVARRTAAGHPVTDRPLLDLLTRAGSTPDLKRLADPETDLSAGELRELARRGWWARQLAVRHPSTPPDALARLLGDDDPNLREWAAAHDAVPTDVVEAIFRAGGARDLQGIAEADPDMTSEELAAVAELGPWAAWVVA